MNLRKFDKNRGSASFRVFARLLDYCFFYSLLILPLFHHFLLENDLFHIIALILLPFFWMFFEGFFIAFLGTTPGKALLGIHIRTKEGKKPSLKTSFKRSFLIFKKVLGFNLPILNMAASLYTLKTEKNPQNFSWDEELFLVVYSRKKRFFRTAFSLSLLLSFFLLFIVEFSLREVIPSSDQEFLADKIFKPTKEKWTAYQDKAGFCKASFLGKPQESVTFHPIPNSSEKLTYTEIKQESKDKKVTYTLSYTSLPQKWVRFGSGLVLRGSLKVVCSRTQGAKVLKKNGKKYKNFPSLEFLLQKGKNFECCGMLVLVGNNLYKLDVTYPLDKKEELEESIKIFLKSFEPKAS